MSDPAPVDPGFWRGSRIAVGIIIVVIGLVGFFLGYANG